MTNGPLVSVTNLVKRFGQMLAVDNVSFSVDRGKFLTLLGPSGCGKTTTLRCVAGLEKPDEGEICINLKTMFSAKEGLYVPAYDRNVGMVFQSYALWPHMTASDNIAYGLRASQRKQHLTKQEVESKVEEVMASVGLDGLEKRYPHELSGGQQQRVALGRAIAYDSTLLLLDEPLSNLDANLREQMRVELKNLQRRLGMTTIYVTHAQDEALVISDDIVVMNKGKIVDQGPPSKIFLNPSNEWTARFVGYTNFLHGRISEIYPNGLGLVETKEGLDICCVISENDRKGESILVAIRPTRIEIRHKLHANGEKNAWKGRLTRKLFMGEYVEYIFKVIDAEITVRNAEEYTHEIGDEVIICAKPENCHVIHL